jgi:Kdo2-lipid IVA lauroyltransferase/acyltransferase
MAGKRVGLRYRLERSLLELGACLVARLPRTWLAPISRSLGSIAYHVDFKGRPVALHNLRVILGPKLRKEGAELLAKESYQAMARNFLSLFWSRNITQANWKEHGDVIFEPADVPEKIKGKPVLWITPHYQSFEMSSIFTGFAGYHLAIVARDFHNPLLTPFFASFREHCGHEVIPSDGALLRLFKHLKGGGSTGLLTDLATKPSGSAVPIKCFQRLICATNLPAQLARRTGAVIVPSLSYPQEDGRTIVRMFEPLVMDETTTDIEFTQRLWQFFEDRIRENPAGWLWMYKQWRYRPRKQKLPYPIYANVNRKFQAILALRRVNDSDPEAARDLLRTIRRKKSKGTKGSSRKGSIHPSAHGERI